MSTVSLTPDQALAVSRRGSSVLVSAAAGSGKTRVLTERLMSYITDEKAPVSIERFLVITYTRAAAAELKSRILAELSLRCAEDPENRRLRRQSALCYGAHIGTIHSFCSSILRENSHKVGISPDFKVGDEDKCRQLMSRALGRVLDKAYENMDELEGFEALVSGVGTGRDDSRLEDAILDLHSKMQSHPYPRLWAESLMDDGITLGQDASETPWGRQLMEDAKKTALYWKTRLENSWYKINLSPEDNAPLIKAYEASISDTLCELQALVSAMERGWDAVRERLPISFQRPGSYRNFQYEDAKLLLTTARDGCKKAMEGLAKVFNEPSVKLLSDMERVAPERRALLRLTLEFDREYDSMKRRLSLVDFSDLEHLAVELLWDVETCSPTETAKALSGRFTEIMVDEYQDVSAVQELIFRSVSRDGQNIFMVGDVKQSIYRFRLADPSIFLEKYRSYADPDKATAHEPVRILLKNNFRSRPELLSACNRVFENCMSRELGEIDYDRDCALYPPTEQPFGQCRVEMALLPAASDDGEEKRPDRLATEAIFVAKSIHDLVENGTTVEENGTSRPLRYSDIAILLRSPNTVGGAFKRALSDVGIPVRSEQDGGFFASPEIVILRSLLRVIDCPHGDIPLASVLASPVFGFTADELSRIRASKRNGDFFSALQSCAETDNKCQSFLDCLGRFQSLSCDLGITRLLDEIYDSLQIIPLFSACGVAGDGALNLMLLSDLAAKYEERGYGGLFGFCRYLDRMEKRGEEPRSSDLGGGDAVSIMSIHKSKGLEFPVVFLSNTGHRFNNMDLRKPVLIHPQLGVGMKLTDTERCIEYPTLAQKAIKSKLKSEMLSEEMRVVYVGMTRAKDMLYITCADPDPEKLISKLSTELSSPMDPQVLGSMSCPGHWLLSSAILDGGKYIGLDLPQPSTGEKTSCVPSLFETEQSMPVPMELSDLCRTLNFTYPHRSSIDLPSKVTATSLPDQIDNSDALSLSAEPMHTFEMPRLTREPAPKAAFIGTATHLLMQFIDFDKTSSLDLINEEARRLSGLGILSPEQSSAVDTNAVFRFFSSPIGQRIKNADRVHREFRFSLLCQAERFFPETKDENILLQGVVDCCIEEKGQLTVIDYKTDRVFGDNLESRAQHYKKQLSAYAYALERIMQKPVRDCLLCFLMANRVVSVPLGDSF